MQFKAEPDLRTILICLRVDQRSCQSLTVSGHVLVRMEIYLDAVSTVNRNAAANDLDRISILSIRNGIFFLVFSTNHYSQKFAKRFAKAESSKNLPSISPCCSLHSQSHSLFKVYAVTEPLFSTSVRHIFRTTSREGGGMGGRLRRFIESLCLDDWNDGGQGCRKLGSRDTY